MNRVKEVGNHWGGVAKYIEETHVRLNTKHSATFMTTQDETKTEPPNHAWQWTTKYMGIRRYFTSLDWSKADLNPSSTLWACSLQLGDYIVREREFTTLVMPLTEHNFYLTIMVILEFPKWQWRDLHCHLQWTNYQTWNVHVIVSETDKGYSTGQNVGMEGVLAQFIQEYFVLSPTPLLMIYANHWLELRCILWTSAMPGAPWTDRGYRTSSVSTLWWNLEVI